jgi:predicted O-linked N-acetylglucosamine transferase (SPINDLY family)
MGVPVLTRIGESFAARMGASLLQAAGLPDLVAATPEAYENIAVELATDPARLARVRETLAGNLPGCALFDPERWVRGLEAAFGLMYERYQKGDAPAPIRVAG